MCDGTPCPCNLLEQESRPSAAPRARRVAIAASIALAVAVVLVLLLAGIAASSPAYMITVIAVVMLGGLAALLVAAPAWILVMIAAVRSGRHLDVVEHVERREHATFGTVAAEAVARGAAWDPAADPTWLRANGMHHAADLIESTYPPALVPAGPAGTVAACPYCGAEGLHLAVAEFGSTFRPPAEHGPAWVDEPDSFTCPTTGRLWKITGGQPA